jgi:hypothetical protein
MKKYLQLFLLVLVSSTIHAQVETLSIVKPKKQIDFLDGYDSLTNFLDGDNVKLYKGQMLYVPEMPEYSRELGYTNFCYDYQEPINNNFNVYEKGKYNTKYSALAGKYFFCVNVIKFENDWFLKLKEKGGKDFFYYKHSNNFPFIVVGYYQKMKSILVGKKIVLRGKNWIENSRYMSDAVTGEAISFEAGSIWAIKNIGIDDKYFNLSALIENEKGHTTYINIKMIFDGYFCVFEKELQDIKKTYGENIAENIIAMKVLIGMKDNVCLLALGSPKKIDRTITSEGITETWTYKNKILIFKNGVLSIINE